MAKRKRTNEQITICKTYTYICIAKDPVTLKTGGELICPGNVGSSWVTSSTRRINLDTNILQTFNSPVHRNVNELAGTIQCINGTCSIKTFVDH